MRKPGKIDIVASLSMKMRVTKKILVTALALFFCRGAAFSLQEKYAIPARKIAEKLVIDGNPDEKAWETAPAVDTFTQFEPYQGTPASLPTLAKVLYNDDWIYFAFICNDPEPEKIIVGMNKRDGLQMGVDSVTVSLDTFHDGRSAYYFRTNVIGVQHDGRIGENGRVADTLWDGIWISAGARNEEGWSAEFAIPFRHIKYHPGVDQTWGIKLSRYIPRRMEKSFWTKPITDSYRKVSTYCALTGLNLKASRDKLEVIPYAISRFQPGSSAYADIGVDARYNFSQNASGHLTVNPDFATVEADVEQVNLTRFELNLPEKRNFFLEGNDIYQQRIKLFYSRRIADVTGGVKLYGKNGGIEYGALSVQARKEDGGRTPNFSVVRLKKDVFRSSSVGLLAANRIVDGKNQGTMGMDTSLDITDNFKFTGQMALSYGESGRTDKAFFLRPCYETSTFHTHIRYSYLGDSFGDNANAVGFVPDDDRHELDSAVQKVFWLRGRFLDRIEYNSNANIYWGMDKVLRSWDVLQAVTMDLHNKLSLQTRHNQEYKLYEKEYRNHNTRFELGYNTREWESARMSCAFGRNFDSDFTLWGGSVSRQASETFSVEYSLTRLTLRPDPEMENTWIHAIRMTQYFTPDLFLKVFYQTNSVIDKRNLQMVFVYRFQPPFGSIQLLYQKGTAEFGEKSDQGDTLFLKLSYVF